MRTVRLLAPVFLLAMLPGCGDLSASVGLSPGRPAPASAEVTRSTEQGGRFITLTGPRRQYAEAFLGVPNTNYDLLRSLIDTRSAEVATQLYVEASYFGAERNYDAARLKGSGETLNFVPVSKNEITCDNGTCSYAEEFAAVLPAPLLQARKDGLTVIFTATSAPDIVIDVPPDLIQKQLAAVDTARAGVAVTPTAGTAVPLPPAAPR